LILAVVLAVVAAAVLLRTRRPSAPAATAPPATHADADLPPPTNPEEVVAALPPPAIEASPPPAASQVAELVAAAQAVRKDREAAEALAARIDARQPVGADDVRLAEDLFARYPEQARGLLESTLVASAAQQRAARRYAEAIALLQRAATIAPRSVNVKRGILAVRSDAADWPGVEAAARDLLLLVPGDGAATRALAYALVRQDRTPEAIDALSAYLDGHTDTEAAGLLDRLRRERSAEGGFEEQRLAHFHVRYDGEAHEDVGREILRVLDRHYATLRVAFDHEPAAPIPVTLFTTRSYYDATGAPSWSGGEYDHYDGRIRVPIGGLTTSLTPDLDSTLLHEVTHAFVTDLSGGLAPREIQEGLAQWTEGKRSTDILGDRGLRALADGRIQGVTGFYLASLVLVEDLIAQRGRSGVNDLLAAMARTGSVDTAFQEVYGRTFSAIKADTASRLRQLHGS
jgi:tetratricopeptide (TPR) repeat protein